MCLDCRVLSLGSSRQAAILNPWAFTSLGTLNASETVNINTDILVLTGGATYTSVLDPVSVAGIFTFDDITCTNRSICGCVIGCGSFREERDTVSTPKKGGDGFRHAGQLTLTGSFEKYCTGSDGHPSYQWPLSYLRPGHKPHSSTGVHDENVHPRNVIGDKQHGRHFFRWSFAAQVHTK